MEKTNKIIVLLLAILVTANAEDYFIGLNIDQNLLNQANAAITDLSDTLTANFNCQRKRREPTIGMWPAFGNLRGHRLLI